MPFRRRSVRWKTFDYRGDFACLVTICTAHRRPLFGHLRNGAVHLSAAGRTAQQCWQAIPLHFPHVVVDAYTIQPDHVHGILHLVGAQHAVPLPGMPLPPVPLPHNALPLRRFGQTVPGSLPVVVRAFKAAVSRVLPGTPVWQRGYHESVLRDAAQLSKARSYVNGHAPTGW